MGNLLNTSVSQTPLVVTAGQQDSRHTITDPLLFGDLIQIARPAVKWAQEVAHADQLPVLIRRALHDANAAPTGPVFLSLPMDVMEEMSTVGITERSVIDRRPVAGSLGALAAHLAAIPPGRLAIIAGDEIHGSDAAAEVVDLAETLAAPVYGSSWPSRIPFPTAHPLSAGNMPTKATEIAYRLSNYDAIFALGGKSLITILYTEGPAVPPGCAVFQMSADVRDLGRTYMTPLSVVGDIQASLRALRPLLSAATFANTNAYAALLRKAASDQQAPRQDLTSLADSQMQAPVITPNGRGPAGGASHRSRHTHRRRGDRDFASRARLSEQCIAPAVFLSARGCARVGNAGRCRPLARPRPQSCGVPGWRRGGALLTAGALDRRTRGTACDLRGDE
jgi:benzoylformate decarboxylase